MVDRAIRKVAHTGTQYLLSILLFLVFIFPTPCVSQSLNQALNDNLNTYVKLRGHHPSWARMENDLGSLADEEQLDHITLLLTRTPELQKAFETFLTEQQDPHSPHFHHWLTPVEVGKKFGVSEEDITALSSWLRLQGLTIESIANSRIRMEISGSARAFAGAFNTEFHHYSIKGQRRISPASEPMVPLQFAHMISAMDGLFTNNIQSMHRAGGVEVPALDSSMVNPLPNMTVASSSHYV